MNTGKHQHPKLVATAIALAVMAVMEQAAAQTSAAPVEAPKLDRIEITGSIIRRVSDETALPVSTISAAQIQARGHVELKELLLEMPESMTIGSYSGTVGTLVNLRGLGQARSLTLMNGRRFANESLTDQYVSANVIPKIALARVETLKDGASSAYGSDAIGGVQNFYTQKYFTGVKIKGDIMQPARSGGGGTREAGIMGGIGDFANDGWNIYGAFEVSKRPALFKKDRPTLAGLDANGMPLSTASADLVAMGGANITDLTTNQTSPANFLIARNATTGIPSGTVYNPYASTCSPPSTVPTSSAATNTTCSFNTRGGEYAAYSNDTAIYNTYVRGVMSLSGGHELSVELNHSQNDIAQFSNVVSGIVASTYYLSLPKTSQWYPGGTGGVPAVTSGTTTIANAKVATSPSTLYLRWMPVDYGTPVLHDRHINDRAVFALEGVSMGWDYRTGLNFGKASRNTMRSGVFNTADLQSGLNNGTLNPFALQNADGAAYLGSRIINDQTARYVTTEKTTADLNASREVFSLDGGPAVLGVGAEIRRDRWAAAANANGDWINVPGAVQSANTTTYAGKVPTVWFAAVPNANQPDSTMAGDAERNIGSLFGELDLPVAKSLTLNASGRYDTYRYSHATFNGFNPKISARWTPSDMVMLRASANTGFRNPSLPEVFGSSEELKSSINFNDPLYCANGVNTSATLATNQVCNVSVTEVTKAKAGGTGLTPEKSRAFTVGFGVQPMKDMSLTVDYWSTYVQDALGTLAVDTLTKNYSTYQSSFQRMPDGSINRIINVKQNAGDLRTSGADLAFNFTKAIADLGTFTASLNVSYIENFESRLVGDTQWVSALGQSAPLGITTQDGLTGNRAQINQWKHTASLAWKKGDWAATVAQRYQSKLVDQNSPAAVNAPGSQGVRDVEPYSQYNVTTTYTGFKNLKLTFGINNVTDVNPPLTNNTAYQAYLTQNADVLGRAYQLSAEYKF